MNVIFHLGSALASIALVLALLKVQRQRDLLRELLSSQQGLPTRVHVEAPAAFLARFAGALGVSFDAQASARPPRRIAAGPLAELFLRDGISLIRCRDEGGGTLAVELHVGDRAAGGAAQAAGLAAALGDDVRVTIVPGRSPQPHGSPGA